jgi:peroxiredoxin
MRFVCGVGLLVLACSSSAGVAADETVTLDALQWKHRVLLLPAQAEHPADWMADPRELLERDLVLFKERDGAYRQWFPKARSPVTLRLSADMNRRTSGRVTLIGKDGGIKRQWADERRDLRPEVFALIDSMPMRRREMRARAVSDGAELIGTKAKEWTVGPEWANSKPLRLEDLRGRVVMVRFWTDTCPYCTASLPAMQRLADEFEGDEVTFVGFYQSKPLGSERPWEQAVARAKELGVKFPIAYDHDWETLKSWWINGKRRRATSASFVIAPSGTIAHVDPGPVFFQSDNPEDARANADYEAIRSAIRAHLPAAGDRSTSSSTLRSR